MGKEGRFMMTIWKYEIPLKDSFKLELPKDAVILHGEAFFIWALVDTEAEKEIRRFRIYGTGQEIERPKLESRVKIYQGGVPVQNLGSLRYVVTIFDHAFVWHLFEEH